MVVIFVSAEILDVNFYMALIGFFIMCWNSIAWARL